MGNKYKFEKLTPMRDADISVYKEAFDFIFENEDIKNIAVSGSYSAGKSSILESYKAKHTNLKFVHISLAQFRIPEQDDVESTDSVNDQTKEIIKESILEGKILNQLIHQIPSETIPQTNFRVKKDIKNLRISTMVVSIFISSILYLVFSSGIANYVNSLPDNWVRFILSPLTSQYTIILAVILSITGMVTLIFSIIRAQKSKNIFRKISLQGNEIEIFEETEDSYFDKYLNEVLYLFEKVDADVIVFEDMDRFDASRIFERLREVNTLVNIHRKKESGDNTVILRFFYLLRDDIFVSKDRTKFFDHIIPVIPIMDSSNSYQQFLKVLKAAEIIDRFDQSFLQRLSLYVDDMRILKNIYNEFVVYFNRLNITDLDCNKMLAIITYKNLFPRDFNNLQLAKGFVNQLFIEKERLIASNLKLIESEREILVQRIELAKKEVFETEQELNDAYSAKKSRLPRDYGNLTRESQKLSEDYDLELSQRKQSVKDKSETALTKLESELNSIDDEILKVKTKSLKELITRENIDSVFNAIYTNEIGEVDEFKTIKSSDYFALLKFLLRNGYIDETYTDYMTYFYDDSLSISDKKFLRRVTDKRGADYTYKLKNSQKVIESPVLRKVDFEQEETLNFDLFDCLLENDNEQKYKSYLETLLSQIQRTGNFDFASKYYEASKSSSKFVMLINKHWASYFKDVLQYQKMSLKQIRSFSIDTLSFCDEEIIANINIDNCLTDYISEASDYLAIENPNVEKLTTGFSFIGVLFSSIDYEHADKELFDEVYRQSLYELNFENISLMLKVKYSIDCEEDIIHKNYTLIEKHFDSPLANYVLKNISEYLSVILNKSENRIEDDEGSAISVLNNEKLDSNLKEQYIKLLSTSINDIIDISDSALWKAMLGRGIIEFSVNNFVNYFNVYTIDEELINYLNSSTVEVDFSTVVDKFDEEIINKLFDMVATCNDINTEKYGAILNELGYCFDNYEAVDIVDEKFEVLMRENILQLNIESLKYVRENYTNHLYDFIRLNLGKYIEIQTTEIIQIEEIIEILAWNIEEEKKLGLLAYTNAPISIINTDYTDSINSYLIEHNLSIEDKPYLYENFSCFGSQTQESIERISVMGVKDIIVNNISVDDSLLSILLQSDKVNRDDKIMLFNMSIPEFDEDTCTKHFKELGHEELSYIFTKGGSHRKYEKNNEVKTILDALKNHEWIYDYKDDEKNSEKYLIKKNRPRQKRPDFIE